MAVRKRLTARRVETAPPGKHIDGEGLHLVVKGDARSWVLRYQINGRRREMGLGRWPDVSLEKARRKALERRQELADGVDPLESRARRKTLTFRCAAEALIEAKRPGWRNEKHANQWPSTLEAYAYPKLGERDVRHIETEDVLAVLRPIWTAKPETASRLRQRIEAVLDYAAALKGREGENPARWKGRLDHLLPAPSKIRAVKHHAAIDWRDAPALMRELAGMDGTSARALAFAILTAARSGEVRFMTGDEVDVAAGVWTVPASRMKAGKEHRVPLGTAALALVGEAAGQTDALVFPSPTRTNRPLSDMSLTAVLKRMGRGDLTVHGFRSTFRDWAGETTSHPREVIEAALAHRLKDKAEAAYARGDLFVKRRRLMEDWAAYLESEPAQVAELRPATPEPAAIG